MQRGKIILGLLLLLMLALPACSRAAPTQEPTAMMKEEPEEAVLAEKAAEATEAMLEGEHQADAIMEEEGSEAVPAGDNPDTAMTEDPAAMMEAPAWFSASLVDISSGDNFTINDHKGKVILVETMAVWCTTCFRQQQEIQALHGLLEQNGEDLISLSLDVDPNEDAQILNEHAARNGFNWIYAIAPVEVAREIGELYGDQFLNPPSAPVFIIDRQGKVHPLPFGLKSAEDLQEALEPLLSQ